MRQVHTPLPLEKCNGRDSLHMPSLSLGLAGLLPDMRRFGLSVFFLELSCRQVTHPVGSLSRSPQLSFLTLPHTSWVLKILLTSRANPPGVREAGNPCRTGTEQTLEKAA